MVVKKFLPRGVSVRLGGSIRGVIPYFHLSDVPIKNPQERFKLKSKIHAMVSVNKMSLFIYSVFFFLLRFWE